MSDAVKFLDRDGVIPKAMKMGLNHSKWTLSSGCNMIVNCILLIACIVGYNTFYGDEDSTRFTREGAKLRFVSADDFAKTITITSDSEEVTYVENFEGYTDTTSFEIADKETAKFLDRCKAFVSFHHGVVPDDVKGPTYEIKTFLPRPVLGNF